MEKWYTQLEAIIRGTKTTKRYLGGVKKGLLNKTKNKREKESLRQNLSLTSQGAKSSGDQGLGPYG